MMSPNLPAARFLLIVLAGSYLLSAAILGFVLLRGGRVDTSAIVGWLLTGAIGLVLAIMLQPDRPWVWIGLLVVLLPWMIYSLIGDARLGIWIMVIVDLSGVFAIGWALYAGREALRW